MDHAEALVELYAEAETWMLRLLRDAVAKGQDGTTGFYEPRADALAVMLRQARRYLAQVEARGVPATVEALQAAVEEGAAQAAQSIPGETAMPTTSINALAAETAGAVASQHQTILRTLEDAYRDITRRTVTSGLVSGAPLDDLMQSALSEYAERGITSFVDRSGRRWGIDSYTRMSLRTGITRAGNEGRRQTFVANDIHIVQSTWHRGSHPWCAPYQGKIMSLDGTAGERTVEDPATGNTVTVDVVATLEEAQANGYQHVNCRHSVFAYIPGMPTTPAPDMPDEQVEAEYEATQRQRAMERHVKRWKREQAVSLTPQRQKQSRAKVREWKAALRTHVNKHDHLSRDYTRERA